MRLLADLLDVWRPPASDDDELWRTRLDRAAALCGLPLDSAVSRVCVALDDAREWEAAFRLVLSEEMWDVIVSRRMRDEIIASFEPWQLQPIQSERVMTIPRSRPIPPVVVTLDQIEPIPFNEPSRAEVERMAEDLGRMMDQCLLSAFRAVTEGDPVPAPVAEQPAYETDRAKLKRRGIRQLMYEHTSPAGMVWALDSIGRAYHVGQTMGTVKTSNDEEEFWRATDRYRQHDATCPCPRCNQSCRKRVPYRAIGPFNFQAIEFCDVQDQT